MQGLLILVSFYLFLLTSCALYQGQDHQNTHIQTQTPSSAAPPPSSSPSPLNTSANPWTNVNPQVQGQISKTRN